jgi:hypothetical protein
VRRYSPALILFILAPLIAEVLFGATPFSRMGGLVVTAPLYGGGALLIRELARRRGGGWGRIALLGAAYGIVEEGLAIQSLFNPALFNAGVLGGRWLGVNWVWTQWTVGYHIVWSMLIPILLTELLFPARRAEPWLGRFGVGVAGALYAVGALALGATFRLFVTPEYRAPLPLLIVAALLVSGLVVLALAWPQRVAQAAAPSGRAPSPWVVGLAVLIAAAAWFALLDLPHALRAGALALLPMLGVAAVAAGVAALLRRWSAAPGWGDLHRLAAVLGALVVSTAFGFFVVTAGNRADQLAQGAAGLVALALLGVFAWRLRGQPRRDRLAADALR